VCAGTPVHDEQTVRWGPRQHPPTPTSKVVAHALRALDQTRNNQSPGSGHSILDCLFTMYQCTRTYSAHPPPWPSHSFPSSSLIVASLVYPYTLTASSSQAQLLAPFSARLPA